MSLSLEPLSVSALCSNSLSIVKEKALAHRIRLDNACAPGLPDIAADARKVKQIIYNLLSNAIKFTGEGGKVILQARRVSVLSPPETGEYFPPLISDTDYLEIAVEDSGIGIAANDMHKLFEPFVQLDSAISKEYEGTGLGLAMVKRLTELHGGALGVESTLGRGSRFSIWLPYRQPSEPAIIAAPDRKDAAAKAVVKEARARTERAATQVLVIDDDPTAARILTAHLEKENIAVDVVYGGKEGIVAARNGRPGLVILDLLMPDVSGFEVVKALKADAATVNIPIVVMTSKILTVADRAVLQGQVAAVVEKSAFKPDIFIGQIRELLHLTSGKNIGQYVAVADTESSLRE
jgi:CheY-like chemotaxis protein